MLQLEEEEKLSQKKLYDYMVTLASKVFSYISNLNCKLKQDPDKR